MSQRGVRYRSGARTSLNACEEATTRLTQSARRSHEIVLHESCSMITTLTYARRKVPCCYLQVPMCVGALTSESCVRHGNAELRRMR